MPVRICAGGREQSLSLPRLHADRWPGCPACGVRSSTASFEEVAYLFLHGRLPGTSELIEFAQDLAGRRALPRAAIEVLREAAAVNAAPMDVLLMAAPLLGLGREDPRDDAIRAIASFSTIVGAYWRVRNGEKL